MHEDRTFRQIITRLKVIFPESLIEVSKVYYVDFDGHQGFEYNLFVADEVNYVCNDFGSLCEYTSNLIAKYDPGFARIQALRNRDWDKLFGGNGNSNQN